MKRLWKVGAVLAVAGVALAGCFSGGTYPAASSTRNGAIGVGLWHTFGGNGCYWERLRGYSGGVDDIIANNFSNSGPRYVEVKPGDVGFHTSGCLPWVQVGGPFDRTIGADAAGHWNDGDYRVGTDIPLGTYQASGANCYWERLNGFGGESSNIIANSFGPGGIVTIAPGDVGFSTSGCGGWTKIA
jgi:hypothetical protein